MTTPELRRMFVGANLGLGIGKDVYGLMEDMFGAKEPDRDANVRFLYYLIRLASEIAKRDPSIRGGRTRVVDEFFASLEPPISKRDYKSAVLKRWVNSVTRHPDRFISVARHAVHERGLTDMMGIYEQNQIDGLVNVENTIEN